MQQAVGAGRGETERDAAALLPRHGLRPAFLQTHKVLLHSLLSSLAHERSLPTCYPGSVPAVSQPRPLLYLICRWPAFPVLVYYKETQTKPEGQVRAQPMQCNVPTCIHACRRHCPHKCMHLCKPKAQTAHTSGTVPC